MGIHLLDSIMDELPQHENRSIICAYRGLYHTANTNLDRAALLIAKKIQEAGFKAFTVPAAQTIRKGKLEGILSHKLVANLAELGLIGKSCLLINPIYGPRIRLVTGLTDAPMPAGNSIPNNCGECRDCVEICPVKAFTGVIWNPFEPREVRFKAHLCKEYTERRAERLCEGICGLCVYACPYGQKNRAL